LVTGVISPKPVEVSTVQEEQRQDADDQARATARVQRPQREEKDAERSQSKKRGADRRIRDQRLDQDERQQAGQQPAAAVAAEIGDTAQPPPRSLAVTSIQRARR